MEFPLGPRCAPSGPAVPGATCGCSGGRDPRADLRPRPPYSPSTPGLETTIVVAGRTNLVKLGCSLEREEKEKKKVIVGKLSSRADFGTGPSSPPQGPKQPARAHGVVGRLSAAAPRWPLLSPQPQGALAQVRVCKPAGGEGASLGVTALIAPPAESRQGAPKPGGVPGYRVFTLRAERATPAQARRSGPRRTDPGGLASLGFFFFF